MKKTCIISTGCLTMFYCSGAADTRETGGWKADFSQLSRTGGQRWLEWNRAGFKKKEEKSLRGV
jgi:hypothetical protein